ncbi:Putative peptide ABC transporter, permease protein [Moritella viscosa]|uniref:Peptide ABC transporter, permease protein n=1 Tax=Moritella viscosa TaxID=80854 RepID=A0A1K9Z4D4_9GAMM|nr:Putative peptide ABC transporter, permease protein [Moritella viscosa]SGY95511.1 Putative peptide ABC transporter, permease protein [Moritella viscosa]SGY95643.1 Putative peptide ABC transporter, permease protein [Moritella viscosa]SHO03892.1 Putative peptide ABC transporter, permease protein [Moritella viscosa]SHO03895.1 Putative peptide ABC transporter, permease protein [Moritella viscosa]
MVITVAALTVIGFYLRTRVVGDLALDGNLFSNYLDYLMAISQGDLGITTGTGQPVFDEILTVFPATLELCFSAFILSILIGVPIGTVAGMQRGSSLDSTIMGISLFIFSIPVFWLASLVMMYFALNWNWLPVTGRLNLLYEIDSVTGFMLIDTLISDNPHSQDAFYDALKHLLLPTIVLATVPTTEVIRQMRNHVSDVMKQKYIKAAASKGLSKTQIILRHVLRNAIPNMIPHLGLQFSTVLTTAMVTEAVFSWPGIGRWLINSIYQQDHAAIQGGMLTVAIFVVTANVLTEILTVVIHPIRRKELYAQH